MQLKSSLLLAALGAVQHVQSAIPPEKIYGQACYYMQRTPGPGANYQCSTHGTVANPAANRVTRPKQAGESGELECRQACFGHPFRCESYSYNANSGICTYSPMSILSQTYRKNTASPQTNSNYRCFMSSCDANPMALQDCTFTGTVQALVLYHNVPTWQGNLWQIYPDESDPTRFLIRPTTEDPTTFEVSGAQNPSNQRPLFVNTQVVDDDDQDPITVTNYMYVSKTSFAAGTDQRPYFTSAETAPADAVQLQCTPDDDPANPGSLNCNGAFGSDDTLTKVYLYICNNSNGLIYAGPKISDSCWPVNLGTCPMGKRPMGNPQGEGCPIGAR